MDKGGIQLDSDKGRDGSGRFKKENVPWIKGKRGLIPWNKGLTAKTDERVKRYTEKGAIAKKGHTPWNKGTRGLVKPNIGSYKKGNIPWTKGKRRPEISKMLRGHKVGDAARKKISEKNRGRHFHNPRFESGYIVWNKGKTEVYSEETRRKMANAKLGTHYDEKRLNAYARRRKVGTSIERILKEFMEGIGFVHSVGIFGTQVDFINFDLQIIVETKGCYVHACEVHFPRSRILYSEQYINIKRDKWKEKVISEHGFNLLVIWEHEMFVPPRMKKVDEEGLARVKERVIRAIKKRKVELGLEGE